MSNINYLSINENFPVPGEDNDTQVFRDNFDTIKQSLRIAQEEITDLEENSARTDLDNDFNNKLIQRAVFLNSYDKRFDGGVITVPLTVDYENGNYQIFRFGSDTSIEFQNFPDDQSINRSLGKVTLELYGNGGNPTNAGSFVPGKVYTVTTTGNTDFTLVGAGDNSPGTTFTATGVGSGTGTALAHIMLTFSTTGGTVIKRGPNFPTPFSVLSQELAGGQGDPVIVEVWRHRSDRIFLNFLGQFTS